jgi:hypothetical protein
MKMINGKIVPPYQPELIKAALQFLFRVQLNGQEAATFVATTELLAAIADGTYRVEEATAEAHGTEI